MKTSEQGAARRRTLSGARQGLAGLGLLALAFILWVARDVLPDLATTRVIATAICSTINEGTEAQLQRAFAAAEAKMSSRPEAAFEPDRNPALHGVTYYLSVTADTPERAKAGLAVLTDALKAAFPSAERNLMVSVNNSTVPAPNDTSRRISVGVRAAVVLLILAGQLLIVVGAYREGMDRVGILAALATPFIILILPSPTRTATGNMHQTTFVPNWKFVLLLLALTAVPLLLGLWLTRKSRAAAGHRRA